MEGRDEVCEYEIQRWNVVAGWQTATRARAALLSGTVKYNVMKRTSYRTFVETHVYIRQYIPYTKSVFLSWDPLSRMFSGWIGSSLHKDGHVHSSRVDEHKVVN